MGTLTVAKVGNPAMILRIMSERGYYRWLGRTMMTMSVILPVAITLLYIVILLDRDAYIDVTLKETVGVFLGCYAVSGIGFLIGRVLAKIRPG